MGKKVHAQKPKKQFKLGEEIIDGTDTLYGALQKKFGIDKDQAQYIQPFVSNSSVHTPGQIPYSKFRQPVANPDVFFKPTTEEPKDISYAVVDAVQRANDIYAPVGGFKAVMDTKRNNPNFGEYDKLAKEYYNTSSAMSGMSDTQPYKNTVQPYNRFMSDSKSKHNIPIIYDKPHNEYGGAYIPEDKAIHINPLKVVKGKEDNGSLYYPTGTIGHELTHSVQGKINSNSTKAKGATADSYLARPIEIHARAAQLNQDYANRTKGVLADESNLNKYVNSYIDNLNELEAMQEGYTELLEKANITPTRQAIGKLMEQRPEYKRAMGDVPYSEWRNMYDMLQGTSDSRNELILDKEGYIDGAKAAKYLKALIMTTAENNQQIQQQPNGVFDNGFNIS